MKPFPFACAVVLALGCAARAAAVVPPPSGPPGPAAVNRTFTASDGARVGYWIRRAPREGEQRRTVLMLPTYTVRAATWLGWFGERFVAAG